MSARPKRESKDQNPGFDSKPRSALCVEKRKSEDLQSSLILSQDNYKALKAEYADARSLVDSATKKLASEEAKSAALLAEKLKLEEEAVLLRVKLDESDRNNAVLVAERNQAVDFLRSDGYEYRGSGAWSKIVVDPFARWRAAVEAFRNALRNK